MRYIGNKTALLDEIEQFLEERGIRGGTFLDIFCGTASVGHHFKTRGFDVIANDIMRVAYTQAVSRIQLSSWPQFKGLRGEVHGLKATGAPEKPLEAVIFHLNGVAPREELIFRAYCPSGLAGRRYFRDDVGRAIDGRLETITEWLRSGALTDVEHSLLLSVLINAADRVANTAGTYGAYLKSWQPNALMNLELRIPHVTLSDGTHQAHRRDANELVRETPVDVLYIDPPYTTRQYPSNYHVLEVIAERHEIEDLEIYEATLYGKTGLRPYQAERSEYCIRRKQNGRSACYQAFRDLVLGADCKHIVISYNEEGILSRDEITEILSEKSAGSFDPDRDWRAISYRRYRSDRNRKKRQYKVLDDRDPNEVHEWLIYCSEPQGVI